MNVAENLLLQQMQAIANMPKTVNAPNAASTANVKKDQSGSFQDMMDQAAGQDAAAVDSGKDNAPAEQQPAQKDTAEDTAVSETKPVQDDEGTEEINPELAMYALDLFRPEIVDVSEPEVVAEAAVEIVPVEETAVVAETDVQQDVPVMEAAPEQVTVETETADIPVETAEAPAEKPQAPVEAPETAAVQETVKPAAEVQKPVEQHTEIEAPEETKQLSDTGEIRSVQPQEKSEDTTNNEDLSGEISQMNQPVFHDVEAAPVKVADSYEPVDTQAPDMDEKLAVDIMQAVQNGAEQMQIRLNPANLGAVTIDLAKDAGGALQVVIHASNSKAAGLLAEHLDSLHTALQSHGSEQTVHIEVQRNQEGQEQHMFQHADPDGRGQHQRQQEEHRQEDDTSGEDFLQKLRLGLAVTEE